MTTLNLSNLQVTRSDLLDAKEWGDGYCLNCGELVHTVEERELAECPHCGTISAVSGADLLHLALKLARCNSPYIGEF